MKVEIPTTSWHIRRRNMKRVQTEIETKTFRAFVQKGNTGLTGFTTDLNRNALFT